MLEIRNVTRRFGDFTAVDNVSLTINTGEFFTLLGPSGCGKTTLLRMLAGFDQPDSGEIRLNGQDLAGVEPEKRPVHTVFQSYALFPHMSVAQNIAFPLKMAGVAKSEIDARVEQALKDVRLADKGGRMPTQLPAASASAWRSPARWSTGRACCCSTNRCRRWTPSCAKKCRSN